MFFIVFYALTDVFMVLNRDPKIIPWPFYITDTGHTVLLCPSQQIPLLNQEIIFFW